MKPHIPKHTPFLLPEGDAQALLQGIEQATTAHPLFASQGMPEAPFSVPDGFWDKQYHQILDRKASPVPVSGRAAVLRPVLAVVACLALLVSFTIQPQTSQAPAPANAWANDALSTSTSTDTELLLEDVLAASPAAQSTEFFDDEEVLF